MTIQIKDALKTVGGISTSGAITTTGNGNHSIGSTSNRFNTIIGTNIHVYDTNAQHYASLRTTTVGTADTQGVGRLVAGNNIASGTAGNAKGQILLYGTNTGYTAISPGYNSTSSITVTLPSITGSLPVMSKGDTSYWGILAPDGGSSWVRTTASGFIPSDQNKTSALGTSSWPFGNIYGTTIYEDGTSLTNKYAAKSHGTHLTIGTGASNAAAGNHTHSYLPLSGGVMTGELAFKEVTSTSYPAKSSSITWNGSTDGANIYYQVDASDKGRLVLNTRDDTDCLIGFAYNGTIHSTIDSGGYFSGKSASADTSGRLDLYRTGQTDNANYVPGFSRLVVREFTNECSNMPSAHFYHIYTGQGGDANYNTQLAVGMTTEALCFRNRHNGSWTGWKRVSVEGHTHNYASSSHSHSSPTSGAWWNEGFTKVSGDGVMEVGKYMDWHLSNGSTSDYDGRFTLTSANNLHWNGNLSTGGIMESGSYAKIQGCPLSIQSSAPGCGGVWIQI